MRTTRAEFRPRKRPGWFFDHRLQAICAFWHQMIIAGAYFHRNQGIVVLVSRHGDGEVIAQTIHRLGFRTERGSSSAGGARGLVALIRQARQGRDTAFTVDGPRGPRHVMKMGPIYTSQKACLPIIPLAIGVSAKWTLPSWDRFVIPKPFSRLIFHYGDPIHVPPDATPDQLERLRRQAQTVLREMTTKIEIELGQSPTVYAES